MAGKATYAVGLLAYELLSGASPFAAPSPTATMTAQLTRIPEPLHVLRSDVPPAFSELVQHCLAKSPDDRPKDAQAVLAELDRISGALAADAHRGVHGPALARPAASSLPLALATFAVLALVAAGFWWSQRNSAKPARADSGSVARQVGDTGDLTAALPSKVMTHADSLQLLAALQTQLKQVDPRYQKKAVPKPAVSDSLMLAVKTREIDSLIRSQFREIAMQRSMTMARGAPVNPSPTAPTPPSVPGERIAPPTAAPMTAPYGVAPKRLLVLLPREQGTDSAMKSLQLAAAVDLAARINRFGQWASVVIDSNGRTNLRELIAAGSADVLAYINVHREPADSVRLQVSIRNVTPGTSFGYRVITSDPVSHPANIAAFNSTLRDAGRLVSQLRMLPPGQVWSQDMGRGFSGPGDRSSMVRTFTTRQMDSMRKVGDSLRNLHRGRRDSLQ